ncbi:restriction endonuclease subunit S [Muricaecibacterium torontonense]|uniref:Restriction endonuclease subunit S n=1 Tax=Muricaecibacterium torontonense TaxID=3032871 RepID=A0A4S2EZ55_9ACTN|nr:restriction endonuclease subunit S [Muricaecibacterium torontonense]
MKFAKVAEPMRLQIVANAKESSQLSHLRDALLPKLMSGEIAVSQIDITQPNKR